MNDKIQSQHRERKAVLYVRQSSAYQVEHNQESRKLQYGMRQRLRQLGWHEIEVVDEDLGRSAAGMTTRTGFERMVADVCLGKVGAVAAREVSRFARNSREWQQLVEVCRVVDTLLIDQETVYAPRQSNDRLLLGLKGSLNEYELDLLRQRSVQARREKARRGELVVSAPAGFLKTADQRIEKDPNRRVQEAIDLVFAKFMELGTVRQTLLWFLEHDLQVPVRRSGRALTWRRPAYRMLYRILTSPIYGGAYAYGKTEAVTRYDHDQPCQTIRRKQRDDWLSLIPNAHEGYVSWEQFERIQQMIADNSLGQGRPGAARQGAALLAGLLRCRRCGRKLTVRYTGAQHDILRYSCYRGWLDNGEARCIAFGGVPVDDVIGHEILRVVQPEAIEVAVVASQQEAQKQDAVLAALKNELEAARYEAQRAFKQYDAVDPDNRLVADELERRWNAGLNRVEALEQQVEQHTATESIAPTPTLGDFEELAADLEAVWQNDRTDVRLKKRIVRSLIEEVIVDSDSDAGEIILVIHWKGGVHTELRLPRRRRGQSNGHASKEIVDAIPLLARVCTDEIIAATLNKNKLLTGRGNRWTRERVASFRSHRKIPIYRKEQSEVDGWMNLTAAARYLGVASLTLRRAVERGEIPAEHPLSDGPWVFNKQNLDTEAAVRLKQRSGRRHQDPVLPNLQQANLDLSTT